MYDLFGDKTFKVTIAFCGEPSKVLVVKAQTITGAWSKAWEEYDKDYPPHDAYHVLVVASVTVEIVLESEGTGT